MNPSQNHFLISNNQQRQNSICLVLAILGFVFVCTILQAVAVASTSDTSGKTVATPNAGDAIITVEAPWTQTSLLAEAAEAFGELSEDNFWKAIDLISSSADVNSTSQVAEATQVIQLLPVVVADSEQQRLSRSMIASRTFSPSVEAQYQESSALISAFVNKALDAILKKEMPSEADRAATSEEKKKKMSMEKSKIARKACGLVETASGAWKLSNKPAVVVEYFDSAEKESSVVAFKRALICEPQTLENFFKNRQAFDKEIEAGNVLTTSCGNGAATTGFKRSLQVVPFSGRGMGDSAMRLSSPSATHQEIAPADQVKKITAVLHGVMGQQITRQFHDMLRRGFAASSDLAYFFINQRNSKLPSTPVALQGYGVIMDIKSTEYKVENIDAATALTSSQQDSAAATKPASSSGPSGLDFNQIRRRYSNLPGIDTLEQRLLHRFQNRFEPFNESSLSGEEWGSIGVKLIAHIKKADAPLTTLADVLQNFPVRVKRIVREEPSDELFEAVQRLHQRYGPGTHNTQITINGRKIEANRRMDLFHMQHMIAHDERLLNKLARIVLPKSFYEPGADSALTKLQGDLLTTATKLRACPVPAPSISDLPRFWIEQDEIMWFNNVETEAKYSRWPPAIGSLLRPSWSGMPNFARRNLFHVVAVADPASDDGLSIMATLIVQGMMQETPMRFGLVLYPDLGEELNKNIISASSNGDNQEKQQQQEQTNSFRTSADGRIQVDHKSISELVARAIKKGAASEEQKTDSSSSSSASADKKKESIAAMMPAESPSISATISAIFHDFFDPATPRSAQDASQIVRFLHTLVMATYQLSPDGQTPGPLTLEMIQLVAAQTLPYLEVDSVTGANKLPWSEKIWQRLVEDRTRLETLGLHQSLPAALFNGILFTENVGATIIRGFNREMYALRPLIGEGILTDDVKDYYNFFMEHHNAVKRFQPEVYKTFVVEGSWYNPQSQEIIDSLQWFVGAENNGHDVADVNHIFSGSLKTIDGIKSLRNFFQFASTCGKSCSRSRFAVLPVDSSGASLAFQSVVNAASSSARIQNNNERVAYIAKFLSRWVDVVEEDPLRLSDKNAEVFAQAAATAAGAGYGDIIKETWQNRPAVDLIVRKAQLLFSQFSGSSHSAEQPLVHTNGRVTRVSDASGFAVSDFSLLETQERSTRSGPLLKCIADIDFVELSRPALGQPPKVSSEVAKSPNFLANRLFILGAVISADIATEGVRSIDAHNLHAGQPFCFSAGLGTSRNRIHAVFDPFIRDGPKFVSILQFFSKLMDIQTTICLNPGPSNDLNKMPIRSFYHYVANSDLRFAADGDSLLAPRATMRNLNSNTLFTMGVDEPDSWLVFASKAKHDLDNIRFSSINDDADDEEDEDQIGTKKIVRATYSLVSLIVSGSCIDEYTRNHPRGLPLVLQPKTVSVANCDGNSSSASPPSIASSDTLVMSNLGYFQLKAFTPGVYDLSIQENSRAEEIYKLENTQDADSDAGKISVSMNQKRRRAVIVNSFRGTEIPDLTVSRNAGFETAQLLDEAQEQQQQGDNNNNNKNKQEQEQAAKQKESKGFFSSIFSSSSSSSSSNEEEQEMKSEEKSDKQELEEPATEESPIVTYTSWPPAQKLKDRKSKPERPTLNIFSLASGHLYERFLRLMFWTVVRASKDKLGQNTTRIKFWLIENQMSPRFKKLLPYLAREYDFDYGLVSYKWPYWLRKQSEKQRAVWAYKILFLDVLFPQDVERVIFVDADQIVNADLHELYYMDLHGAPVGYTPFCREHRRDDTKGFRFWDSGFWADHLSGKPYHISAIYVVDLKRLRKMGGGDSYRITYERLSADPNSLANLDQDLPNFAQHQIPIFSLPESWLWCETWCDDESKKEAKTIDLCNNPRTKAPKLEAAKRIIPEWESWDAALTKFEKSVLGEK